MRAAQLLLFLLFSGIGTAPLLAQLDTIHWLSPMYAKVNLGDSYIDLTTPETTPFPVYIRNGAGALLKTVMLSRAKAYRYQLSRPFSQLIIPENVLQEVLPSSGIMIHGPKAFHAAYRFFDDYKLFAQYLPCKGRSALGTVFRVGHTFQVTDKGSGRNNMIGILATENNTEVTISGYNPNLVEFDGNPIKVTLQSGESFVVKHYVGGIGDDQPRNGFMGALLTATKPVAVTSGSWLGAPVVYDQANDICIDQLLPIEEMGKDYILCRGNGPTEMERPIVIAHTDNTKVWVNGEEYPDTTLQAGQYYTISTAYYIPQGNMYIRTSEPAFVFQMIGGFKTGESQLKTGSWMVVPPIQCGLPQKLDYVLLPNRLNETRFGGGLMVVAQRDATVRAWAGNFERPLSDPVDVPGNPEFVTYRTMDFFSTGRTDSTLRVESSGSMQVSLVVRNKDISYAALFSGPVIRKPEVHLSIQGDGICPDTLEALGVFDQLQWIYDDSLFLEGPTPQFMVLAPGKYKAIGYLNGCRQTMTTSDSIVVPLTAPQFQYSSERPSCFDFSDGQIDIGIPNGGTPPYRYSIDFGQHFSSDPFFNTVHAGLHKLVVEDASGCYNEPVHIDMGQPDSVFVDLYFKQLPEPLRPREEVIIVGSTGGNPISAAAWVPQDTSLCADCLEYTFRPETSTWVKLTVYDAGGCPGIDSILVLVTPPVYAPNVIRLGADSGNGVFSLFSEKPILVKNLRIYESLGRTGVCRIAIFSRTIPQRAGTGLCEGLQCCQVCMCLRHG
jgi:hypothetical protein